MLEGSQICDWYWQIAWNSWTVDENIELIIKQTEVVGWPGGWGRQVGIIVEWCQTD